MVEELIRLGCDERFRSRRVRKAVFAAAIPVVAMGVSSWSRAATDLTWTGNISSVWSNSVANWTYSGGATGWQNGTSDIAHFSSSSKTGISVSGTLKEGQISFENSASTYIISSGTFTAASGGNVTLQSNAGTNLTETINTNFNFSGSYGFNNADPDSASSLVFGGILQTVSTSATTNLALSGGGGGTNLISGTVQDGTSEKTGIVIGGTSPWEFSGANTYTGGTSVSTSFINTTTPATMILSGSSHTNVLAGTGITIGASTGNGALQILGNVSIGNSTANTGSLTLAGGNGTSSGQGVLDLRDTSINTLTLNNNTPGATDMTIGSSSGPAILDFDISTSTNDQIVIPQKLAIGTGGAIVNLNFLATPGIGTYTLISTGAGLASGTFSSLEFSNLSASQTIGSQTYTLAPSTDGNSEWLEVTSSPEPASGSLLIASSVVLLGRRRAHKLCCNGHDKAVFV